MPPYSPLPFCPLRVQELPAKLLGAVMTGSGDPLQDPGTWLVLRTLSEWHMGLRLAHGRPYNDFGRMGCRFGRLGRFDYF